ncbi:phosphatase phospho-type [Gamsiella multidivaricata]|uniref:phosphatase phospho-type n=1 Tax=Gamsiella multidivaricata TaxID=101098 RepID=UPI00221E8C66|nr:phosphatase phospho-type [Gamsiella multidivaricata]KAI7816528.1 phosphatase phospho-type [Gamsiella multidivaricata]
MPTSTVTKRLVVFDFDWTLIEADSDYWVVQHLGGEFAKEQVELFGKVQWTDLQDMLLGRLYDRGITRQDLERILREVPFTPEMIAALRAMKSQGAELCIISDANTFYIDTILKAHGIDQLFTKIITNPAHFDSVGRLRITRFHGLDKEPHGCPLPCHPNLCKGHELQKLIDAQSWDQVIYMGDSTNDFCPSTRLQTEDLVLARASLLLEKEIRLHPELVRAKVLYWESPKDALAKIQSVFDLVAAAVPRLAVLYEDFSTNIY